MLQALTQIVGKGIARNKSRAGESLLTNNVYST
jgi:hypothetical protein